MARIRTIKPEFWSSPAMGDLELGARLLFVAMWNWADDSGRGTANPRELGGFAFPHDEDVSSKDIRRMLGGIRRAFDVVFYEVDGRPYYLIPSWDRHQKIDKRSLPRYPDPSAGRPWNPDPDDDTFTPSDLGKWSSSLGFGGASAGSAEDAAGTRRGVGAGTGEQGNRGSRNRGTKTPSPQPPANVAAARIGETLGEGEGPSPEEQKTIDAATAVRRDWLPADVLQALRHERVATRDPDLTREALLIVAKDPETSSPGRLAGKGPWWPQASGALRRSREQAAAAASGDQHDFIDDGNGHCSNEGCGMPPANRRHTQPLRSAS